MVRLRLTALISLLLAMVVLVIFHQRSKQLDASNLALFQEDVEHVPLSDKLHGLLRFDSSSSQPNSVSFLKELPPTVMPKMGNNTARQQLGRSTWRLLHVMAARYPENPTSQEREAFEFFVVLLSRLYPCGDCAEHFQKLLQTRKPNFPNRQAAILWMCETHNIVNKRLGKKIYDCSLAADAWKCGCDEP